MPKSQENYQELSRQLDDVMSKLQSSETDIDDAVKLYDAALKLIEKMETHLEKAETRVRELKAQFGEGK